MKNLSCTFKTVFKNNFIVFFLQVVNAHILLKKVIFEKIILFKIYINTVVPTKEFYLMLS